MCDYRLWPRLVQESQDTKENDANSALKEFIVEFSGETRFLKGTAGIKP